MSLVSQKNAIKEQFRCAIGQLNELCADLPDEFRIGFTKSAEAPQHVECDLTYWKLLRCAGKLEKTLRNHYTGYIEHYLGKEFIETSGFVQKYIPGSKTTRTILQLTPEGWIHAIICGTDRFYGKQFRARYLQLARKSVVWVRQIEYLRHQMNTILAHEVDILRDQNTLQFEDRRRTRDQITSLKNQVKRLGGIPTRYKNGKTRKQSNLNAFLGI